ncbi:MAG: hypothetical protein ACUVX8_07975 [Candidatus Zipacnadales bacterium]
MQFIKKLNAVGSLTACTLLNALAAADLQFAQDAVEGPYDVQLQVPFPGSWPPGAELCLVFDYESGNSYHAARLTREGACIEKQAGAETRRLSPVSKWPSAEGTVTITVKRRLWEIEILSNGRTVTRAFDEAPLGGRLGLEATGVNPRLEELLVQPVEPPVLTDDFMCGPDEQADWRFEMGTWETVGLAGGKGQLRPDLSANPFSMRCRGKGVQFATTGEWYWDSYMASVAVKATDPGGAIGLAFYVQDPQNYYVLSLGNRAQGSAIRLLRVIDGRSEILVSGAGGYEPDVWYRLTVRASNGLLRADIDGIPALVAFDTTFGQGPVGLWALECGDGWFDDLEVKPWWGFMDPLISNQLSGWLQVGGTWRAGDRILRAASTFERPGTILVGPRSWRNYEIAADIIPADADGVGLYACAESATHCYLLHWATGLPMGNWQLMRLGGGRPTVLALAPGNLDPHRAQRVSMAVSEGLIDCRVNGQPIISGVDFELAEGAAGLRVDGGSGAQFSNVTVCAVETPYRPIAITEQFAKEDTMADWARPSSDWPYDAETKTRWFRLPVFGDVSIRIPFQLPGSGRPRLTVHLGTVMEGEAYMAETPQLYVPGLEVECVTAGDGGITVICRRGGEVLSHVKIDTEKGEHLARLDKVGKTTRVWLDGERVLGVDDGTWLENSAVGLSGEGALVKLDDLETYSTHMREYTFSGAPTDWRPQFGVWQVTDRWSCFPGWAWYGGSKHESPLLWSKRQFYGDQTFEFWGALEMDTSPKQGGYLHPSDINCTIAGDGRNLCSGYSFIFAGDNNTTTKLMRGNQVVAENRNARLVNPTTGNFDFHRHWFHIKVVKVGAELHMAVDGHWVLRWQDPQPLAGGHVAVWSYNHNGILIARARATAQVVY